MKSFAMKARGSALGILGLIVLGGATSPEVPTINFDHLLQGRDVPGAAFAIVRDGEVVRSGGVGVRDTATGEPVDDRTVFEAASLSKPVFAFAVLQLVDAKILSLDTPLARYAPGFVKGDRRAASITVRDVLSHSSGLPNWRSWITPLKTRFDPGSQFSYSGEGFIWLQRAVVAATGEDFDALMARLVFEPLGMRDSSFVWRADFAGHYAVPHHGVESGRKNKPARPMAAYTLHTTAADYARFLQAVLCGARLESSTAKLWLQPRVAIRRRCIECLKPTKAQGDEHVAWGLGWGVEPEQQTFFHWGDNGGFKAFVMGSRASKSAVVVLTNGSKGMSVMPDIIDQVMPGEHPSFAWLNYD